MSDITSMNRERKKNQLRRQIVPTPSFNERADYKVRGKRINKKWIRIMVIIVVILLVAIVFNGCFSRYSRYRDYTVVWEEPMNEGSYAGYLNFGSNVLKYTKDGASYIDSQGKTVWIQTYEMKEPMAVVSGDYAVIAEQQGNSIYIFDKSGHLGTATALLPIIKISASSQGVVAAVLEDGGANYITLFRQDGTPLDISIKGLLNGEVGFPMDLSLSPDSTQLIGSYLSIKDGTLRSRVAFHNFSEVGKNIPNRLTAGFEEVHAGNVIPRTVFLNDTYSCAFAKDGISFYSSKNVLSPELIKKQEIEEEIKSIMYSDKYVGIIVLQTSSENPYRIELYEANGTQMFRKEFDYEYQYAEIDGESIFLYDEGSCKMFNVSGAEKFFGTFDFPVSKVRNGRRKNTLIVAGPKDMKEIKLH